MPTVRRLLLAGLVALTAACVEVSPAAGSETDDGETITTVLYPGWNLVGWVGPDTPTSELFDAVPALRQVWGWDAESQSYQLALRDQDGDLPTLTLGMGLWLRLGGNSTIDWNRTASDEGVLLDLRRGQNLLGWTGGDGAGVADTLARFGDDLMEVWHWDADRQRYVPYPPGSDAARLATLARGQALRIELARDTRWWEPGTARPTFVFAEDITAEQREEVRALFESATDVIARRFGVHTTDYTVNVPAGNVFHCSVLHNVVTFQFPGCRAAAVAHEHFHVLQNVLSVEPHEPYFAPDWMNEGTADYAQYVYDQETGARGRNPRFAVEQLTRTPGEVHNFDRRHFWLTYAIGFIAAEWLADHAGEDSLADFYRLGRSHDRWQDAFRPAFGIEVRDFYKAVEVYRHERAPLYPHLTDGRTEPVVVSLSDAASQAATEIRDAVLDIAEFYEEDFGGPAVEYTVYVVDPEAFPSTFVSAFGRADRCVISMPVTNSMTIVTGCRIPGAYFTYYVPRLDGYGRYLASNHFSGMLDRLAPPLSTVHLRTGAGVHCIWGIFWLCRGVPEYAAIRYEAHTGAADLEDTLRKQIRLALNTAKPLSSFENRFSPWEDFPNIGDRRPAIEAEAALFSLAAHWLAEHAGDTALLEYFRLLPSAQTVDEAFEGAFGFTFEEFYEQFEAYRATLIAE